VFQIGAQFPIWNRVPVHKIVGDIEAPVVPLKQWEIMKK
jgi:hypothetical protein